MGDAQRATWCSHRECRLPALCALSAPCEATPGSMLSLMTLNIMGFSHYFIPLPRKKKEENIEFEEELEVVFNGKETPKSSVRHLREKEIGAWSTLGGLHAPFPTSPNALCSVCLRG